MIYVKVTHLFFVMAWMAGIFYLPRILVHCAEGRLAGQDIARVLIMGRKLNRFSIFTGSAAVALGLVLMFVYGISGSWLHLKILFVLALIVYQWWCGFEVNRITQGGEPRKPIFYRIYNEATILIVLPIIYLAIAKPY